MKTIAVFSIIDFYMQSLKMTIVENMRLKYEIKQKPTIFIVGLLNYTIFQLSYTGVNENHFGIQLVYFSFQTHFSLARFS